jgi:hypothetical protein
LGFELPLAVVTLVVSQRCDVLGHAFLHFAQLKQRSCMAGTSAALAKSGCASGVPASRGTVCRERSDRRWAEAGAKRAEGGALSLDYFAFSGGVPPAGRVNCTPLSCR